MINKVKWVLGILMVFLLVLATNLIDRRNFQTLQNSIEVIYEKQLVSKSILLELSTLVHEKAMANALSDSTFYEGRNQVVNSQIDELFVEFEETKLDAREQRTLDLCNERLHQIMGWETERIKDHKAFSEGNNMADLARELEKVSQDLTSLATIQLEEGRSQKFIGESAMSSIEMFNRWEGIFLIIIAVVAQILILYTPKRKRA